MDRKFVSQTTQAGVVEQDFWLGRAVEERLNPRPNEIGIPEPRHSLRRALDLEVVVNHGMTYSVPSQVNDLSLTGTFVELDGGQLPEGSYVEVVLRFRYKGKPIEHRLPATVKRVDVQGMALTFGAYDDQAYTDLANLLYAR